jgi:hypothetical protein
LLTQNDPVYFRREGAALRGHSDAGGQEMKYVGIVLLAFSACTASPSSSTTQEVTGTATGAIAVRAVSGTTVVAASSISSSGDFTLALPPGATYRLEVLTSGGVTPVVTEGSRAVEFKVCQVGKPISIGHVTTGTGSGSGSGYQGHDCGSGTMGSGMSGHGGHGGSDSCDADPDTCGCSGGSDCWGSGAGQMCGSDGMCGSGGTCDHPPGDVGCGSGSGSD